MVAYVDLLENRNSLALEIYKKLTANASEIFPVTYNRSNEMINRINN